MSNMNKELIDKLAQTMSRVEHNKLSSPIRPVINEFENMGRHSIIIGPRGTGKTTLLLNNAKNKRILYFSADDFDVPANGIHDIAVDAFSLGYEGVFIDEIHYDSKWEQALKSLYDKYEDRIIWASDSSSLQLRSGIRETARRFLYKELPLMSFREYIYLRTGKKFPIIADPFCYEPDFKVDSDFLYLFEEYKKEGFLPIFLTGDYDEKVKDIITKTISSDIPYFVPVIKSTHMQLMKEILRYLSSSNVPRIETENLTRQWNTSYEKLIKLLHVMEETGLISIITEYGDSKEKFSRSKVFLTNPSAYRILGGKEGNLRESLTALSFKACGMRINASAKEEAGDFIVTDKSNTSISLEVGGRKKKNQEKRLRNQR